ncbi:hypothetical protein THAOC_06168, partial [Thalassiosira oceanica]
MSPTNGRDPSTRQGAQLDGAKPTQLATCAGPAGSPSLPGVPPKGFLLWPGEGEGPQIIICSPSDPLFDPVVGPSLEGFQVLNHEVDDVPHVRVDLLHREAGRGAFHALLRPPPVDHVDDRARHLARRHQDHPAAHRATTSSLETEKIRVTEVRDWDSAGSAEEPVADLHPSRVPRLGCRDGCRSWIGIA